MAKVTGQIDLHGGEPVGGLMSFEPGSRLEGQAQVTPEENINSRRVVVRVGWHTEGRGIREGANVGEVQIAQGPLTANTLLSQPFAIDLPREPWSFTGSLVSIVWEARLVVDIPLAMDFEVAQPFNLAPRR